MTIQRIAIIGICIVLLGIQVRIFIEEFKTIDWNTLPVFMWFFFAFMILIVVMVTIDVVKDIRKRKEI